MITAVFFAGLLLLAVLAIVGLCRAAGLAERERDRWFRCAPLLILGAVLMGWLLGHA